MTTRLENWAVILVDPTGFIAPELLRPRLQGHVYRHPRHTDGKLIVTSEIRGGKRPNLVRTNSRTYELGAVDAEYAKRYPDAMEQLFASAPPPQTGGGR